MRVSVEHRDTVLIVPCGIRSQGSQHLTCACWANLRMCNEVFCFCRHEHSSGYYRASSYFFGKLLAELIPRRLLPSIIFTLITYVIAGK